LCNLFEKKVKKVHRTNPDISYAKIVHLIGVAMKKEQAIKLAGGQQRLAELLGISQPSVSQWKEEVPIARQWQLRVLKPEWFSLKEADPI
jgi:hypothetical protein